MKKLNSLSHRSSYFDQLVGLASHTVVSAGAGALVSKIFVPLTLQQGAIVGAAVGTATGLVQKLVHMATKQKEIPLSNGLIAAATLGALFFGATSSPAIAASLLGRIGLDLSKNAILKLCIGSFVGEVTLAVLKNTFESPPSAEEQVAKLSKEELQEAFNNFDARIKDDAAPKEKIPTVLVDAYLARFARDGLYKAVKLKDVNETTKIQDHVVRYFFENQEAIEILRALKDHVIRLKLAPQPKDKEAVEKMTKAQIYWAFSQCASFLTDDMTPDAKTALAEIINARHVPQPKDRKAVKKMTPAQIYWAFFSYTSFTTNMTPDAKRILNDRINQYGHALTKKEDVEKMSPDQIAYAYKNISFTTYMNLNVKTALVKIINERHVPQPEDRKAVKKMSSVQIYWAFFSYTSFTTGMNSDVKEALNARINGHGWHTPFMKEDVKRMSSDQIAYVYQNYIDFIVISKNKQIKKALVSKINAHHAPKTPEDVTKMSLNQLVYACKNYAEFTNNMDQATILALRNAIIHDLRIDVRKPASETAVKKLSNIKIRIIRARHETLFNDGAPLGTDTEVIRALNARYKGLGLQEVTLPASKRHLFYHHQLLEWLQRLMPFP